MYFLLRVLSPIISHLIFLVLSLVVSGEPLLPFTCYTTPFVTSTFILSVASFFHHFFHHYYYSTFIFPLLLTLHILTPLFSFYFLPLVLLCSYVFAFSCQFHFSFIIQFPFGLCVVTSFIATISLLFTYYCQLFHVHITCLITFYHYLFYFSI